MNKIEWTDRTWNPVRGCSRVSEGCRNCYAERMAARFSAGGEPFHGFAERVGRGGVAPSVEAGAGPADFPTVGRWTSRVELIPSKLDEPLRWRKPARVFVNSMSDLFHESLTNEDIAAVFGIMAACPNHTFQVLTKRPKRMRAWFASHLGNGTCVNALRIAAQVALGDGRILPAASEWPLPNVWLGVSVEDNATAYERIPLLLQTPAAVRFVSYEPALGPVILAPFLYAGKFSIDWLIVGGESGPGARPCDVAWVRSAVMQCKAAEVAAFVKQFGAKPFEMDPDPRNGRFRCWLPGQTKPSTYMMANMPMKLRSKKGGDPSEWPEDLRVREFPT